MDRIVGSVDFKILNNLGGYLLKDVVDKTAERMRLILGGTETARTLP